MYTGRSRNVREREGKEKTREICLHLCFIGVWTGMRDTGFTPADRYVHM